VTLASCAWTMTSSSGLPSLARCSSIRAITNGRAPRHAAQNREQVGRADLRLEMPPASPLDAGLTWWLLSEAGMVRHRGLNIRATCETTTCGCAASLKSWRNAAANIAMGAGSVSMAHERSDRGRRTGRQGSPEIVRATPLTPRLSSRLGWKVFTIWECEVGQQRYVLKLAERLSARRAKVRARRPAPR
jgi:hypothetical protein